MSYKVGDVLKILNDDSEWWFAEHLVTGAQGWIIPTYGHLSLGISPYQNLSDQDKLTKRFLVFKEIITYETEFVNSLQVFVAIFVSPMILKDTPFKRALMGDASLGLCLSLIQDIFTSCQNFLNGITRAQSGEKMAESYQQFAPSLQLFAQYTSENAKALNSLKQFGKPLTEYMKKNPLPEVRKTFKKKQLGGIGIGYCKNKLNLSNP